MMDVIIKRCAGLDVHKKSLAACVRIMDNEGRVKQEVKSFGAMTGDLFELSDWLGEHGVTDVAMESTGVLWKPVFNILESRFKILLCNAKKIKHVPGRKTDVKDSEWIAQLLQHGLLTGSFIPPRPQRELRDLTRHRAQLTAEKTRQINRIHKVLEDANIKLSSVASSVVGASGRAMLRALIAGEKNPRKMAQLAQRSLRNKIPELERALLGKVNEHHCFLLKQHLDHVEYVERQIEEFDRRIETLMHSEELNLTPGGDAGPVPFLEAQSLMVEMTGLNEISIPEILAEIGADMSVFPAHRNLTSWAKLCPGTEESAGKRKNTRTGQGNRWLRRTLCQCAWAASHSKNSYFAAQYKRLARKRGKKRAIIAVAHSMLITIYHILKHRRAYQDLGADYFDKLNKAQIIKYHTKRLESFSLKVTLEPLIEAA